MKTIPKYSQRESVVVSGTGAIGLVVSFNGFVDGSVEVIIENPELSFKAVLDTDYSKSTVDRICKYIAMNLKVCDVKVNIGNMGAIKAAIRKALMTTKEYHGGATRNYGVVNYHIQLTVTVWERVCQGFSHD